MALLEETGVDVPWAPARESWQAEGATTLRERVRARTEALRRESPTFTLDEAARRATAEVVHAARARSHD